MIMQRMEILLTWLAIVFLVVAVALWILQKFPDVFVAMFFSFLSALMACVLFGKGNNKVESDQT